MAYDNFYAPSNASSNWHPSVVHYGEHTKVLVQVQGISILAQDQVAIMEKTEITREEIIIRNTRNLQIRTRKNGNSMR